MKKEVSCLYLLILCSTTLLAQYQQGPRVVSTKESSAIHVPPQEAPAGLTKIFSNLGKSGSVLYFDHRGWLVAGPHSADSPEFVGMRFIPKFDSHVSQVRAALQYFGLGANRVNLSLYADSNGSPGTLLAGPVTIANLPVFGTCCLLAIADFAPVAVTGGTPYWVVADTPLNGTGSDSVDAWDFVVPVIPQAFNVGSGWFSQDVNESVAGEVGSTSSPSRSS